MSSVPSLRTRIAGAFDEDELKALCFDHFPSVYDTFTTGMTKGQMIQLLLDYCMRRQLGSALLDVLEHYRPGLIGADREALLAQLDVARLDSTMPPPNPVLFLRNREGQIWQETPETPPRTTRIFLSYKRNTDLDEVLAMRLDTALRHAGHEIFIDRRLRVGVDWAREIERQIQGSDFMLVLLSRQSISSEMMLKEVEYAHRWFQQTGKARLLPVRVDYTGPLPYHLGLVLNPLQYALWHSSADDLALISQLLEAVTQTGDLPSPQLDHRNAPVQAAVSSALPAAPLPAADPAFIETLLEPSGVMERESPFYIERAGDELLRRQLLKPDGTMTTIRAPRQTGKSSLLYGGLAHVVECGQRAVLIDLQRYDDATLVSLDSFLRSIAATLVHRLRLDLSEVDRGWIGPLGSSDKLTYLMEDYVLPALGGGLVLAIDEADRLLGASYRDSFFGLLRSWFNGRTLNPLWKKLNTVLVISTEPYLLIRDVTMSPFNVGLSIQLDDFTFEQVHELNQRYRAPLEDVQVAELMEFLNGHPYLTHKTLYTLATTPDLTWKGFMHLALGERSPLGDHIRRYYWMLRDQPELRSALLEVIHDGRCADELIFTRLVRAGLVRGVSRMSCAPRCRFYADVLRDQL